MARRRASGPRGDKSHRRRWRGHHRPQSTTSAARLPPGPVRARRRSTPTNALPSIRALPLASRGHGAAWTRPAPAQAPRAGDDGARVETRNQRSIRGGQGPNMTSKIIFKNAALWTCVALGARWFAGCVVDSSPYHETSQDGDPSETTPAQSALSHAPLEGLARPVSWSDAPHVCDFGFLGGAACDQYCKSQRHASCGYCEWNDTERRNQCQCKSDPQLCSQ